MQRLDLIGGALAATLILAGCGQRQPPPAATPIPTVVPAPPVAADSARRAAIQQSLSYSGEIRAREQVSVMPKASGRIERLLVDIGSRVNAGDTIAVLEHDSAEMGVLQARAGLAAAQARLATVRSGARAEDLDTAQAALNQQQLKLNNMLSGGRVEDVEQAQAAVVAQQARLDLMLQGGRVEAIQQAQDALDAANARLAALQKGATDDARQAALSAVQADTAGVASAEAAYAALGSTNAADLQAAQAQVDTLSAQVQAAQASVDSTNAALANLQGSAPAEIQQAQSAYEAAVAQLNAAQAALQQSQHPTQADVARAQAALAQAQAQQSSAEASQTALEQGVAQPCADTPVSATVTIHRNSTACGEAKAAADSAVSSANAGVEAAQGQLDLLKRGGGPAQQAQLQSAVDQARASVAATKLRVDALKQGGIPAERAQLLAQREGALSQLIAGQQSLVVAQARLNAVQNGAQDAQVKSSAAQVTAARERLKSDVARLDQILGGPTEEDLQQAQSAVDQAQQQLLLAIQPTTQQEVQAQRAAVEQARLQLQKARAPYTDADLQQQQEAVNQAAAQLQKAQHPYTDQDLAAAQAAVDQAEAQLNIAQLTLQDTVVVGPVDGVVLDRPAAPGALVSPQTVIVTLVPPSLEVVVNVDESQLGAVNSGQNVLLQVAAFPAQTFSGAVKSVAPALDARSRTAAVRIEPADQGNRLRAGMFARLNIITGDKSNALVVPRSAVVLGAAGVPPEVMTIDSGGRIRRQPVTLGLQNDQFTEILSGLDEGQVVATSGLGNLNDGDVVAPQLEVRTALVR